MIKIIINHSLAFSFSFNLYYHISALQFAYKICIILPDSKIIYNKAVSLYPKTLPK